MELVEVWGPPTSLVGRLIQVVFLATLLGALPVAFAGRWLLAWNQRRGGGRSAVWARVSRVGVLFQACGVLSSLLLAGLFLSEADIKNTRQELFGPLGAILGLVCLNLAGGVFGLRAWRALRVGAVSGHQT